MAIPIRNQVFDRIQTAGSLTDVELSKSLAKGEIAVKEDGLNKILLDLEILGLINVAWITKDTRRVEIAVQPGGGDDGDEDGSGRGRGGGNGGGNGAKNGRRTGPRGIRDEKDYEAGFPGA